MIKKTTTLDIQIHGKTPSSLTKEKILKISKITLAYLRKSNLVLGVVFLAPKKMQTINKQHRRIDRPTDVLSFTYSEHGKRGQPLNGDILICPSYVKHQASENNIPYSQELARVFIHGILHVAGYDHAKSAEEKKMFSLQERILKKYEHMGTSKL